MASGRTDLATYAAQQFAGLATLAGVSGGDVEGGFKFPIDRTLSKWLTSDTEDALYALMDYYTLSYLSKKLASKRDANVSGSGGVTFAKRTERNQLREDLADAKEACEMYGYDVGASAWDAGVMYGDFLDDGSGGRSGSW